MIFPTTEDLIRRVTDFEDNFIERKPERQNKRELRQAIVAFANSVPENRTAVLYIGVADDGRILGSTNPENEQKNILEVCRKECYPPIQPKIQVLQQSGVAFLAVVIQYSKERPHFAGQAYVREGSQSVVASPRVYEDLIASRHEKARVILQHKNHNEVITVECFGKKLGQQFSSNAGLYYVYECWIEECTPLLVKFFNINRSEHVTEPMQNLTVSWDDQKNRFKLIVRLA